MSILPPTTSTGAGKGDKPRRNADMRKFWDNYDIAFGRKVASICDHQLDGKTTHDFLQKCSGKCASGSCTCDCEAPDHIVDADDMVDAEAEEQIVDSMIERLNNMRDDHGASPWIPPQFRGTVENTDGSRSHYTDGKLTATTHSLITPAQL